MSKQVVDLKEQDIENLKVLKTRSKFLIEELGQISLLEIVLKERKEQAKEFRLKSKEMEIELAEYLEKQYGTGNVDLETGKFTPVSG